MNSTRTSLKLADAPAEPDYSSRSKLLGNAVPRDYERRAYHYRHAALRPINSLWYYTVLLCSRTWATPAQRVFVYIAAQSRLSNPKTRRDGVFATLLVLPEPDTGDQRVPRESGSILELSPWCVSRHGSSVFARNFHANRKHRSRRDRSHVLYTRVPSRFFRSPKRSFTRAFLSDATRFSWPFYPAAKDLPREIPENAITQSAGIYFGCTVFNFSLRFRFLKRKKINSWH